MSVNCPHCQAANEDGSQFCVSCGKALPIASGGPRVVSGKGFAASSTGQSLQLDELQKQARSAFRILLTIAILQLIVAALAIGAYFLIPPSSTPSTFSPAALMGIGIVVGIVGLLFLGLSLWARRSPLPAAITGLVVLISLWVLDILANPAAIAQGILIKILIIAALGKAVSAGMKHRALRRQLNENALPANP